MGYSKKNLRDLQDMAVQHGLSRTQEARFPGADLGAEQTGMNYLIVKPGQREAFAHRHRTAEEICVVWPAQGPSSPMTNSWSSCRSTRSG